MASKEPAGPMTPYDKDGKNVDNATFEQILEMDDDEDEREFSHSIVLNFFEQAANTFAIMDRAVKEKNFAELSSQGHFLKGSSATLGITKVKDSCEKIQHLGARKDESGNPSNESDAYFLAKIEQIIKQVRVDYKQAEVVLKKFYEALGK